MTKKAVVLMSGGLDSATVLALAKSLGYQISALTFDYGQRHRVELESVKKQLEGDTVFQHYLVKMDLSGWVRSALVSSEGANREVPKTEHLEKDNSIPPTYVPARNTIFLSYALSLAESIGSFDIFMGGNQADRANYPDCTGEYVTAFEKVANLATGAARDSDSKFRIHAPLSHLGKAETIHLGLQLGVDYSRTSSCYDPSVQGIACGKCLACHVRLEGFKMAGVKDPVAYQNL